MLFTTLSHRRNQILFGMAFSIGMIVAANFWMFRSTQITQDFIRYVLQNQWSEADRLLAKGSDLEIASNHIKWIGEDGTTCELKRDQVEYHVLEDPKRPSRKGMMDVLIGRRRFQLCAMRKVESGLPIAIPIYCTTHHGRIVINHVGAQE